MIGICELYFIVLLGVAWYHSAMDDSAQNQAQIAQQPQGAPQTPQVPPVNTPQQVSVTGGGKEREAAPVAGIAPSHPEVVIPEVVAEAGVQKEQHIEHEVQLTPEQKAAGIEPAKEATPVPTQPTMVQLPDDYKAPKGFALFHQQVKKAATWLMLLLFKSQQQQALQEKEKKV